MDNKQNKKYPAIPCPECDTPISLPEEIKENQILECVACGIENEVLTLNPLKISPLEEEK